MGVGQQAVVDNLSLHVLVQAAHLALQTGYRGITLCLALGTHQAPRCVLCTRRGLRRLLLRVLCLGCSCPGAPKLLWAAQVPSAGAAAEQPPFLLCSISSISRVLHIDFSYSGHLVPQADRLPHKVQECVAQEQAPHKAQALWMCAPQVHQRESLT